MRLMAEVPVPAVVEVVVGAMMLMELQQRFDELRRNSSSCVRSRPRHKMTWNFAKNRRDVNDGTPNETTFAEAPCQYRSSKDHCKVSIFRSDKIQQSNEYVKKYNETSFIPPGGGKREGRRNMCFLYNRQQIGALG